MLDIIINICYNEFVINNNNLQMDNISFKKVTNDGTIAVVSLSANMVLFDTKINRYSNALLDLGFIHHNTEITDAGDNTSIYTFTFTRNNTKC